MKKYTTTIIIIAVSLILGLITGLLYSGKPTDGHEVHATGTEAGEEVEWTCSMHPAIRQPEFGDCPICGMDLIPLENDVQDGMDASAIRMSETAMALADIRTAVVGTGPVVKTLTLNGVLEKDERRIDVLSSHISGRVEALMLDFTGQRVEKGDVIASVYSPELVTAQKELFEALQMKETQPKLLEFAKTKLKNWKLSDEQINEIIASGAPWDNIPVLADISGVVTGKRVNRGDYVRQGQPLYEISDLSQLWMLLDVYEKDIAWLKTGDSVFMRFTSRSGKRYTGTIDYIDPVLNTVTRVAKARVNLSNTEGHLKPGMYGTGVVLSEQEELKGLVVIPASAVMWTGKRSLVYVKTQSDDGIAFKMREVILEADLGDHYALSEGLEIGEVIAVSGTFSIDAAAQLSGKGSMMNPEGGAFQSTHDHGDVERSTAQNSHDEHKTVTDHEMPDVEPLSISDEARQAIAPVYTVYLDLKNALVNDKVKLAKRHMLMLQKETENIDMSLFTGDAHHELMKHLELIGGHIPDKKKLGNIERIRTAFEFISDGMIGLTKAFTPVDETLYVQYCPMAFDNKGADWISRSADIKNPYFGASMLTCGDVIDTLKTLK